jgi:hypothetical protein
MKGTQKSLSLSLLNGHRGYILLKFLNSSNNISNSLCRVLLDNSEVKQCVMLTVHRVHNDALASSNVYVPSVNRGTVLLAPSSTRTVVQISGCVRNAFLISHGPTSLKVDLLASLILSSLLQVASLKGRGFSQAWHLGHRRVGRSGRGRPFFTNQQACDLYARSTHIACEFGFKGLDTLFYTLELDLSDDALIALFHSLF